MKKHLGLFISIFLAMISITGALFIFGGKNITPTPTKTELTALGQISANTNGLYEVDEVKSKDETTNQVKPTFIYTETTTNVYEFTITNTAELNTDTYIWRKRAYGATNWENFTGNETATLTLDTLYDIVVIYEPSPDVYIESEMVTLYRKCIVKFSLGNDEIYSQQNNVQLIATKPTNPKKDEYIFAGWYQNEDGTGAPWDFDNDHIIQDTTLYAQWTSLVCENEEENVLNQFVNRVTPIKFKINVQDMVEWYLDKLKQSSSSTTFECSPNKIGTHIVYCIVDGVKSNEIECTISYYVPDEIKIISNRSSRTSYTLRISNEYLSSIDTTKFAWYCGNQLIAEGVYECFLNVSEDCEVYAVYKKDDNKVIQSNSIKVTPSGDNVNIPLVLGIGGCVLLAIFLFIFIRKKYIRYKNRKDATIFTWHKW